MTTVSVIAVVVFFAIISFLAQLNGRRTQDVGWYGFGTAIALAGLLIGLVAVCTGGIIVTVP
jgi:hypothetical protein